MRRRHLALEALEVVREVGLGVAELHRAAAEHVRGPHEQREPDLARRPRAPPRRCARCRTAGAESRARRASRRSARGPRRGRSRRPACPAARTPGLLQAGRDPQRGLAAELDDHALGLLDLDDLEHVLDRERLEVEARGGVVVGRHGLRVAIDHHRVAAASRARSSRRARSSSRTRCPVRSCSGPSRGSRRSGAHRAAARCRARRRRRSCARRRSRSRASRPRTPRHRCRPTCRTAAGPPRSAPSASRLPARP